jgi:hypothetical protein
VKQYDRAARINIRMPWQHKTDDSSLIVSHDWYCWLKRSHPPEPPCLTSFNLRCLKRQSSAESLRRSLSRLSVARNTTCVLRSSAASIIWQVLASSSTFNLCWRKRSIASSSCRSSDSDTGLKIRRTDEAFCSRIDCRNCVQSTIMSR